MKKMIMMALMVVAVSMAGMAQDKGQKDVRKFDSKRVELQRIEGRDGQVFFVKKLDQRDFQKGRMLQAKPMFKAKRECRGKAEFQLRERRR